MTDRRAEGTFTAVKPDDVHRGLTGEISSRFENRGYKFIAATLVWPIMEHLSRHCEELTRQILLHWSGGIHEFWDSFFYGFGRAHTL